MVEIEYVLGGLALAFGAWDYGIIAFFLASFVSVLDCACRLCFGDAALLDFSPPVLPGSFPAAPLSFSGPPAPPAPPLPRGNWFCEFDFGAGHHPDGSPKQHPWEQGPYIDRLLFADVKWPLPSVPLLPAAERARVTAIAAARVASQPARNAAKLADERARVERYFGTVSRPAAPHAAPVRMVRSPFDPVKKMREVEDFGRKMRQDDCSVLRMWEERALAARARMVEQQQAEMLLPAPAPVTVPALPLPAASVVGFSSAPVPAVVVAAPRTPEMRAEKTAPPPPAPRRDTTTTTAAPPPSVAPFAGFATGKKPGTFGTSSAPPAPSATATTIKAPAFSFAAPPGFARGAKGDLKPVDPLEAALADHLALTAEQATWRTAIEQAAGVVGDVKKAAVVLPVGTQRHRNTVAWRRCALQRAEKLESVRLGLAAVRDAARGVSGLLDRSRFPLGLLEKMGLKKGMWEEVYGEFQEGESCLWENKVHGTYTRPVMDVFAVLRELRELVKPAW